MAHCKTASRSKSATSQPHVETLLAPRNEINHLRVELDPCQEKMGFTQSMEGLEMVQKMHEKYNA